MKLFEQTSQLNISTYGNGQFNELYKQSFNCNKHKFLMKKQNSQLSLELT